MLLAFNAFQALLYVPQTYFLNSRTNPSFTWLTAVAATLVPFCIYVLLMPPVIWLALRFPFERRTWVRNLLVHLICSFAFSALHLTLLPVFNALVMGGSFMEAYRSPLPWFGLLLSFGAGSVLQYWIVIIICQAIIYFRKYREREHDLTEAQLQALKTQLNPHFLFNTLNAISELVYENAEEAEQTIGKLSELLRFSLKTEQAQEIPLHQELEFLRIYLEIQQTLLQERLKICWRITPETYKACVPNMILQPLVENSIRHGIVSRRRGGTIKIVAVRKNNHLVLSVQDDGLGLNSNKKGEKSDGIGLQNTRTRLRHLYGDEQQFTLEALSEGEGTAAVIEIPFIESEKKYDSENTYFDR